MQVKRELDWLYVDTGAVTASCVGGMDIRSERLALGRGAHIVVGTPGRLRDHITRNALDMSALRVVVLDEADEMLDLGFREDLEFMLDAAPDDRRTLMFSATVAAPIAKLAKRYQRNALRLSTSEEQQQHVDIEYRALVVAPREAENAIVNVLRYYEAENALVFCNTRAAVNRMLSRFSNRGFSVVALSGELSQNERTHALQALRDGRARVCIATDVAARGIDLPKLELVIHADLPSNPETLLHRSGRTGRAGRKGVSAIIVEGRGRAKAERLLRAAKIDATWANAPSAEAVTERDRDRIVASPALTDAMVPEEADFTTRLLEGFTAEQLATAVVRLSNAGRSAPEDIEAVPVAARSKREPSAHTGPHTKSKESREFANSQWVTLSVGRKQNAEPRWLIPLVCNAGDLTKADIGYIRIEQNRTHVELDATIAGKFLDALGPNGTLEKNVRVTVLDGRPDFDKPDFSKPKRGYPKGDGYKGDSADESGPGPAKSKPYKKKFDGPKDADAKVAGPKSAGPKGSGPKSAVKKSAAKPGPGKPWQKKDKPTDGAGWAKPKKKKPKPRTQ